MKYNYIFKGLSEEEIKDKLYGLVDKSLDKKYSEKPDIMLRRIEDEWSAIKRLNLFSDIATLYELSIFLKENKIPYWAKGTTGSSFIFYILGITEGNPLPPHYYCPKCKRVTHSRYSANDGFDLSYDEKCARDGTYLIPDGHDIPWQTVFGYGDSISPYLSIAVPEKIYEYLKEEFKGHWLCEPQFEIHSFDNSHLIYLSKIDIEFHTDMDDIPESFYNDKGARTKDFLSTAVVDRIMNETEFDCSLPRSVADLIYIMGLSKHNGSWDSEVEKKLRDIDFSFSDMIAFRDDVFRFFTEHHFPEKDARRYSEWIRKGKKLPKDCDTSHLTSDFDKFILRRFEKIKYLFPKAHVVEYMLFLIKVLG